MQTSNAFLLDLNDFGERFEADLRLLQNNKNQKEVVEEPIRVAGVPVPQIGTVEDSISARRMKFRRENKIERYKHYLKTVRLFRKRLIAIGIEPIVIVPTERWYEICRALKLYHFINITDRGYVTVTCNGKTATELMRQKLPQEKLKRGLWIDYNNLNRIGGQCVKIILPIPPQEVQEVLAKVHQNIRVKNTDEDATPGGETYIFAEVGVALEERSFIVDDDIGIVSDGKTDPIVFLNTHNRPGVTAIVAQYGDFNLEKEAIEKVNKIIYGNFL